MHLSVNKQVQLDKEVSTDNTQDILCKINYNFPFLDL